MSQKTDCSFSGCRFPPWLMLSLKMKLLAVLWDSNKSPHPTHPGSRIQASSSRFQSSHHHDFYVSDIWMTCNKFYHVLALLSVKRWKKGALEQILYHIWFFDMHRSIESIFQPSGQISDFETLGVRRDFYHVDPKFNTFVDRNKSMFFSQPPPKKSNTSSVIKKRPAGESFVKKILPGRNWEPMIYQVCWLSLPADQICHASQSSAGPSRRVQMTFFSQWVKHNMPSDVTFHQIIWVGEVEKHPF